MVSMDTLIGFVLGIVFFVIFVEWRGRFLNNKQVKELSKRLTELEKIPFQYKNSESLHLDTRETVWALIGFLGLKVVSGDCAKRCNTIMKKTKEKKHA